MYNPTTEDQFFQPKAYKEWRPDKNHRTIKRYIEATKNALEISRAFLVASIYRFMVRWFLSGLHSL